MVVGLTGRYCAGKDTVARLFAARGYRVLDVDALGHEALTDRAEEVRAAFGPSVLRPDGTVDRRTLGRLVFGDPRALSRLEGIIHPVMVERVKAFLRDNPGDVLVNAAVLHRMGLAALCGAVVCVTAPLLLQLCRAVRRDGITVREALARISSQGDVGAQLNGPAVDTYTVRNRGTSRSLERRVERILRRMKGGEG
ncbi:MAG: dephospho-CoA kinase [Spirochaetes bacterium]|jgi:dephospho-CoA kinase|nr:dephospho-CoA kinase [Spirochaetota bacterium]